MQKTILIIDDNAQLGEMLTQTFEQSGYAALYAENGAAAFSFGFALESWMRADRPGLTEAFEALTGGVAVV